MFENFVVFTEAAKLSSNLSYRLKEVNYHDKLLSFIREKRDVIAFAEVIDLVENKSLITEFIDLLNHYETRNKKRLTETIFKAIDHIDITAFYNILLVASSENGLLYIVKYLVEHDADIHVWKDYPLIRAVETGNLEVAKYLMGKGANVNTKNSFLILDSAEHGELEVLKCLLENPDCKVCKGDCRHAIESLPYYADLLSSALYAGNLEMAKYLIGKGIDITKSKLDLNFISKKRLEVIHFFSGELLKVK